MGGDCLRSNLYLSVRPSTKAPMVIMWSATIFSVDLGFSDFKEVYVSVELAERIKDLQEANFLSVFSRESTY